MPLSYSLRAILDYEVVLGTPSLVVGIVLIVAAIILHAWTAKLIGIKATISYIELKPNLQSENQRLVTSGPFSVVRHPYWAYSVIITGIFLITGIVIVGIIIIVDLAITYFITTTLEDRKSYLKGLVIHTANTKKSAKILP